MIPFNKPYVTGKEIDYINEAVALGKLASNGEFSKRCEKFMENRYGLGRCFMTTSCTSALEMSAMLCGIGPGDEVILPSFTYVSTAAAFTRTGANVRFVDSTADHPNIDWRKGE